MLHHLSHLVIYYNYLPLNYLGPNNLHLQVIDVPILILHAEDDLVVPFKLGRALYESALEKR